MNLPKDYILVTGANGFIGSHLVDALIQNNEQVVAIDKHKTPQINLETSSNNPNLRYLSCDIGKDISLLETIIRKCKYIYHLGAIVGVQNYLKNPFDMFESNILGSYNLIKFAYANKIPILFASTSEIYGKNPNLPWNENADRVLGNTTKDRWSYSTGKALIEHLLISLGRNSNFNFKIVRFFNVYGPRQNPIFVVPRAINKALKNLPIEIFDGGNQTRSFIYISDTIRAILEIQRQKSNKKVYNIGNDVEISVKDLYSKMKTFFPDMVIKEITTSESHGIGYEDLMRRVPDISRLLNDTNWKPEISLESGLHNTIDWAKKNRWWIDLN